MDGVALQAIDFLIRLLPGVSIIVAILLAKRQLAASRRATAVSIAKNYYREFITICLYNSDIVYMGATDESLAKLKGDEVRYRRYRWLVTQALFALQEVYFAMPDDPHWRRTICVVSSSFKAFILSPDEIPARQRAGWNAQFMAFLEKELAGFEHPVVSLGVRLGPENTAPASPA